MLTEEEVLDSIPDLYNLDWWPREDFNELNGFNLKSSEEEFVDVLKKFTEYLGKKTKGNIFKVLRSKFKIRQTNLKTKNILLVVDDNVYGEGEVMVHWWINRRGGKLTCTLQVSRKKGADPIHIKAMLNAVKYLMDGFLENGLTKAMLDSFILKMGPKTKDECSDCGYIYKTPMGEILHKCDLIKAGCPTCPSCDEMLTSQDNLKIHMEKVHGSEPMQVSQSSQQSADQVLSDLLDKVVATKGYPKPTKAIIRPSVLGNTAPVPPKPEISIKQYIFKNFPGAVIKKVKDGGACQLRAVSYVMWQTDGHYKTIGKAISKYILSNYEVLEGANEIYYPLTRKLAGEELTFHNKEEFQRFLRSEESLYAWREGTDLEVISTLFQIQIIVLVSKNGKLDGGKPIVFGEKFKIKAVLLHNEDEGHYSAVIATDNPNKNFTMLNNVKRYVDSHEVQKKNNVQNKSGIDLKNDKDKIDSLMMRLGVLESRMNFYEAEKKRNDEENKKLRERIDALKAYKCNHQPVAQQPVICDTNQSNLFQQPGQVIPPSVVFMDTSEKTDDLEDLNRL